MTAGLLLLTLSGLLVSGGVSVGPHDHVKPAFEALGVEEVFWRVRLLREEPGSLKAMCPSGPMPPMKRSTPP